MSPLSAPSRVVASSTIDAKTVSSSSDSATRRAVTRRWVELIASAALLVDERRPGEVQGDRLEPSCRQLVQVGSGHHREGRPGRPKAVAKAHPSAGRVVGRVDRPVRGGRDLSAQGIYDLGVDRLGVAYTVPAGAREGPHERVRIRRLAGPGQGSV